jgi:hypothetical protein
MGAYLGSTIANYATVIRAWYMLHGVEWRIKDTKYKALLEGAAHLAPSSSKQQPKRVPFTIEILECFCLHMDLDNPHDSMIFACLTCSFFSKVRLGEFMISAIAKFDPLKHLTRQQVKFTNDHKGLPVIKFKLPFTKTSLNSKEVHCAPHPVVSPTDTKTALDNYFAINSASPQSHLFTWKHPLGSMRPLYKRRS